MTRNQYAAAFLTLLLVVPFFSDTEITTRTDAPADTPWHIRMALFYFVYAGIEKAFTIIDEAWYWIKEALK